MVEFVGVIVLTGLALYVIFGLLSMVYLQWGFAGISKSDIPAVVIMVALSVLVAVLWWLFIGTHISISFGG